MMRKSIKMQIEAIQDQIDAINAKRNNETLPLTQELNLAFDKAFDNSILIQELIKAAEASVEYAINEYGELSRWVRVDVKALKDECLNDIDRLRDYLADHAVSINLEEEVAEVLVGDFIAIQEDYGDVFYCQLGMWRPIAERQEYDSKEEMKAIIQKFMNERDCNLPVVKVGRYGDVRVVSV